jgi:hypothetical protein
MAADSETASPMMLAESTSANTTSIPITGMMPGSEKSDLSIMARS